MNISDRPQHDFDARAQALHRQALASLDPATLARLRAARHAAGGAARPVRHRRGLWLATACSAVLALGLGIQLNRQVPAPVTAGPQTTVATVDGDELLDQNPDLYVWLGAENALAMEQTQ